MISLVTGGAGFIGSHVVDELIELGHEVVVLDDLSGGFKDNVNEKAVFVEGSINDVKLINELFEKHKFDYVYHLAAYAAEGLSHFIKKFNYENNLIGSINLINASVNHNVKCFVFTSSIAVYGTNQLPMHEDLKPEPEDPYGIAKYAVEQELKVCNNMFGLNYIIFRPHNCYDKDTEILTSKGFKLIKDVIKDDLLATLNSKTNTLEYHKPVATQKIRFKGELYHFKSKPYDLMVTPDHKIWCKKTPKSKYGFAEAKDLASSKTAYSTRLSSYVENWKGQNKEFFEIGESRDRLGRSMANKHQKGDKKRIRMEGWMEFLGWYISEGSKFITDRNYVVSISQNYRKNKSNFDRIIKLIEEMGFTPYFTKEKKEVRIFSKQIYDALNFYFDNGCENKKIPYEFKQLSKPYLKVLFETLMKGDGDKNGYRYSTKSKRLSDDFFELLLKLGKSGTVSKGKNIYRVYIGNERKPQLGDNKTKKTHIKKIPYDNFVYDVTVPNHIIFVRRNGKGCWSSNCYGERQNLGDKYRNVLGIFMNQIMKGEPLLIFGDGEQTRAFSHIDDVAPIIAKSVNHAEAYNHVFNVGADKPYSVNELVKEVVKSMGHGEWSINYSPARNEVKHAHSTHEKCKKFFNHEPKISLSEGVQRMVEWAKKHGTRESKEFDNIEIMKNMPPAWVKK